MSGFTNFTTFLYRGRSTGNHLSAHHAFDCRKHRIPKEMKRAHGLPAEFPFPNITHSTMFLNHLKEEMIMKRNFRKITTGLMALTITLPSAVSQMPLHNVSAVSAAPVQITAAPAESEPAAEEEIQPAVTTGPAEAFSVNTGTYTTMPKAYAPIVTTTTTGFDDCSLYIFGTNNCVTGIWPDDSEITTTTTTTATSGCDDYVERLRHAFDPSKDHSRYTKTLRIGGMDTKTEYQIGEQLDPSQIYISASGMYEDEAGNIVNWDIFYSALNNQSDYEIDDSKFDSTKPGKYEITVYLPLNELPDADGCKGTFTVEVAAPGDTTTERHSDIPNIELLSLPKTDYLIGEELDLSGAMLIWGEGPIQYDGKVWWGLPLDQYPELVDASGFDNTKPGTYRIYVNLHDSQSPGFDLQTYYDVTVSGGCFTTCTSYDWEQVHTDHFFDNYWWEKNSKDYYYDGAPNDGYKNKYYNVGEEFEIRLPYAGKDHKPMYDTTVQTELQYNEDNLVSNGYLSFTDTAIIWHSKALKEGTVRVVFKTASDTGIG